MSASPNSQTERYVWIDDDHIRLRPSPHDMFWAGTIRTLVVLVMGFCFLIPLLFVYAENPTPTFFGLSFTALFIVALNTLVNMVAVLLGNARAAHNEVHLDLGERLLYRRHGQPQLLRQISGVEIYPIRTPFKRFGIRLLCQAGPPLPLIHGLSNLQKKAIFKSATLISQTMGLALHAPADFRAHQNQS